MSRLFQKKVGEVNFQIRGVRLTLSWRPIAMSVVLTDRTHPLTGEIVAARLLVVAPFNRPYFMWHRL